jgi:hypothetical protein
MYWHSNISLRKIISEFATFTNALQNICKQEIININENNYLCISRNIYKNFTVDTCDSVYIHPTLLSMTLNKHKLFRLISLDFLHTNMMSATLPLLQAIFPTTHVQTTILHPAHRMFLKHYHIWLLIYVSWQWNAVTFPEHINEELKFQLSSNSD